LPTIPAKWRTPSGRRVSTGHPGRTVTRAKLFAEWADQPILVIGTHYAAPTAGRVKRDRAAFRFEV
jgi:hypothetical protein